MNSTILKLNILMLKDGYNSSMAETYVKEGVKAIGFTLTIYFFILTARLITCEMSERVFWLYFIKKSVVKPEKNNIGH
ncbi:hypothetical protein [Spiroplasma poulsonii]|uniref:hypothetical protein n=1 Tax=Spiroplasma poulsonii TaxID=2138 RepID=UPI001F4CC3D3|nr:hypothetical protein [Spiroplasma poulsonii]UNF61608.1 hypothetical protein MNU24_06770 [Spiroplasma poulsonii]